MSEELVQEYLERFRNLSSSDPETVNRASSQLLNVQISEIPVLAAVFHQTTNLNEKKLAMKSIQKALETHSRAEYMAKREEFFKDQIYSKTIDELTGQAIQNDDKPLRNFASKLISMVIGIEKDQSVNIIEFLINCLKERTYTDKISSNIIDVFNEVFELVYFSEYFENPIFFPYYIDLFQICQNGIVSEDPDVDICDELRISACQYILYVIRNNKISKVIIENEKVAEELLESLLNSLKIINPQITDLVHQIMLSLFEQFHEFSELFMKPMIFNAANNIVNTKGKNEVQLISVNFLYDIALYESKLNNMKSISEEIFPQIADILFGILNPEVEVVPFEIRQTYNESEKAFISPLYERTGETILMFSYSAPDAVFEIVTQKIDSILDPFSEKWEDVVFALGLFLSIISPSIDAKRIHDFLGKYWDGFIIKTAENDKEPLIRSLGLSVIRAVLENVPSYFADRSDIEVLDFNIDEELFKIIGLMDIFNEAGEIAEDDPNLVILYARIIDGISKIWNKNNFYKSRLYFINTYLPIQGKIDEILNYGFKCENYRVARAASFAIYHLILFAHNKDTTEKEMIGWYRNFLELLSESFQRRDDFEIISNLCFIIGSFALRINEDELSERALNLLLEIMNKHALFFNDTSNAIKNLIIKNSEKIEGLDDQILFLYDRCYDILNMEDNSSICNSCQLISILGTYYFEKVLPKIPGTLEKLFELFDKDFTCNVKMDILLTIGSIFESLSMNPEICEGFVKDNPIEKVNKVISIIEDVTSHDIYFKNIENENDYFRGILKLYKGFCMIFMFPANIPNINDFLPSDSNIYGDEFYKREKIHILLLYSIAKKIYNNINLFSNEVVLDYYDVFHIVILRCSKKNNTVLSRDFFQKLIKYGKFNENEDIKSKSEEVAKAKDNRDKNK